MVPPVAPPLRGPASTNQIWLGLLAIEFQGAIRGHRQLLTDLFDGCGIVRDIRGNGDQEVLAAVEGAADRIRQAERSLVPGGEGALRSGLVRRSCSSLSSSHSARRPMRASGLEGRMMTVLPPPPPG